MVDCLNLLANGPGQISIIAEPVVSRLVVETLDRYLEVASTERQLRLSDFDRLRRCVLEEFLAIKERDKEHVSAALRRRDHGRDPVRVLLQLPRLSAEFLLLKTQAFGERVI
jgi:hypothetical protein